MEIELGECCKGAAFNEVCGECRLDLMLFFLKEKRNVLDYLRKHDYRLYREITSAEFRL